MTSWYKAMRKSIWTWTHSAHSVFLINTEKACLSFYFSSLRRSRNPRIPTPVKVINLKKYNMKIWILFRSLGICQKLILFSIYLPFFIVHSLTCTKVICKDQYFLNQQINNEFQQQNKSLTFSLISSNMFSNKMPN